MISMFLPLQMNDNYNGMMDESPNRQSSPTNRASTPSHGRSSSNSSSNHMNHQTTNSNSNHQTNNGTGSPHSPLSNDSMVTGGTNYDNMNCDNIRSNLMGSSALDGALLNGVESGNGINDIMLGGGLGSDSSSKLITSSSAALQTSLMMSQTSPSHHPINTQTTTSIPEIVFSGESEVFFFLFEMFERSLIRKSLRLKLRTRKMRRKTEKLLAGRTKTDFKVRSDSQN